MKANLNCDGNRRRTQRDMCLSSDGIFRKGGEETEDAPSGPVAVT